MAYLLRSNISVNDPDGRFPFYSRYGITHKELAVFMQDMEQQGYIVEQSEFTALATFITNLKSNLLWDKIHEVYPIMGNGLDPSLVKLKSLMGGRTMSTTDGFDVSLLEMSGGKVLGKGLTAPTTAGGAPRVETGVTVESLMPGAGLHFYCGNAQGSGAFTQPVIGALQGTSGSSPATQLAVNIGDPSYRHSLSSTTSSVTTGFTNEVGVLGVVVRPNPDHVGTSAFRDYYFDGEFLYVGGPSAFAVAADKSVTLSLFGRNAPLSSGGAGTSIGYSGIVRFGCVTDGYWTEEQVATLHSEINTLVSALGKSSV